ncbi:hypothetical protein BKA66DRAFT_456238 [Pyrenochaeta sp. MPI-SDFR-AT-0127]|nr:hypothetical protein BKA66DRAFT_456238 [Pyrenochaeta sp. MPI-SDFR-AT-0127]
MSASQGHARSSMTSEGQARIPLFFYGTLQDPAFLKNLLSLSATPVLRRATLKGYKLKLWSFYPILVPQEGAEVQGMVWDGATQAQFGTLEYYEGDAYTWAEATVEMELTEKSGGKGKSPSSNRGVRVFVARDTESKEIEDGEWSLEEFQDMMER